MSINAQFNHFFLLPVINKRRGFSTAVTGQLVHDRIHLVFQP